MIEKHTYQVISKKTIVNPDQILSSEEAAKMLGKCVRTIQMWATLGKIPAFRVDRFWRFKKEDIEKLCEK